MSGYGKSTPRAWRTGASHRSRPPTRDDVADLELEAERFRKLAPTLGFCGACGREVDEAKGRLHEHDCPYLGPERRYPKCPGIIGCHRSATIDSGDFGVLCAGHYAQASDTSGT